MSIFRQPLIQNPPQRRRTNDSDGGIDYDDKDNDNDNSSDSGDSGGSDGGDGGGD